MSPETETVRAHTANVLTATDVCERAHISRNTLYRLVKAGRFPAPVRFGTLRVHWLAHEVDAWLEARVADRDSGAAA